MMEELSKCVRQEVKKLVPLSLLHEVTCFIFNDKHPLDTRCYDIVVCTTKGEVIELLHRQPVSSLYLSTSNIPLKIDVYRNTKNNVYFLVATANELFIINRNSNFSVMRKIQNYQKYVIDDSICSGKSSLKVWCCDDALPMKFNEELEMLDDMLPEKKSDETESDPLCITLMKTKLNQAKYAVSYNTKLYEDVLRLRHMAAFSENQCISPNNGDAIFQDTSNKAKSQLRLASGSWIKMCNQQVVMAWDICNESDQTISDLEVILHGNSSLVNYQYTIFEQISSPPYWKELHRNVNSNSQVTISLVINIEELKRLDMRSEFKGIVTYTISGKEYLLPISEISIPLVDLLDEKFDVMSNSVYGTKDFLAMLSTTVKSKVTFIHPHNENNDTVNISDLFVIYLKMQKIPNSDIVIHRESPYHPLNGIMICFNHNKIESALGTIYFATAYTRSLSQLILLTKYMYDAIPYKLLLLPHGLKVSSKVLNEQICVDNDILSEHEYSEAVIDFGKSLLDQMTLILKYYDKCIVKMGDSNSQQVLEMIGEKIDLYISGREQFEQFASKLNEGILKGIKCLEGRKSFETITEDVMIVDNQ